jgi:hypothetical protein
MATKLDTTNWAVYPFEVNNVQFLSLLDKEGEFYPQIERLPAGVFTAQNCLMVTELIGDPSLMTREELADELDRVNLGATQAILALA